jgi:catechol 2,3-dioxygenase-like lactoylglutathione lyase family enzyme
MTAPLTGLAHGALCVPDVDAAVRWYSDVLGFTVLSPPFEMSGDAIDRDMGELMAPPVVVKAAIVGFGDDDHVLELIEYPGHDRPSSSDRPARAITDVGLTHVGLVCTDVVATRRTLEERGVVFLTSGTAQLAGLRTTWFCDPWGTVFILIEKRHADRPYWRQHGP